VNTTLDIVTTFTKTQQLKAFVDFYKEYQSGIHLQGFLDEFRATIRARMFS